MEMRRMKEAKKTMIYLDETEHKAIKYLALTSGISMAEQIRRALAEFMKRQPRKAVRK